MAYTRSVIITGGTINLGYHTALQIARQHPDWLIVISSRSDHERAAESINKTLGQNNVVLIPLDLSESKSIRAYAQEWSSKNYPPIQALLLNAALQFPDSGTHDPAMKSGLPDAIYTSAEELARPPPVIANGPGRRHYANSKLANIMWTYALHKHLNQRIPDRGITVNAFDPGLMPGSGLAREYSPLLRFVWNKIMPRTMPLLRAVFTPNIHKPSESAASLVRLATADDVAGVSGKYFEGPKEIRSSKASYDEKKQDDLWQWTVKYCAQDEAEAARFEEFK
ncbi:hypothetical protein DL769_006243 [Monosporascus sp. CRB-8-3]|nr:hypothetical protein DL769_006243 [Monosporascus sp. CRB-8-3]